MHYIIFILSYSILKFYAFSLMHCIVFIVFRTLYSMHCSLCIVCFAFYILHFMLCIVWYALLAIHCLLCIVSYTLFAMHCVICILLYALYSMHFILCIVFLGLYSWDCILFLGLGHFLDLPEGRSGALPWPARGKEWVLPPEARSSLLPKAVGRGQEWTSGRGREYPTPSRGQVKEVPFQLFQERVQEWS